MWVRGSPEPRQEISIQLVVSVIGESQKGAVSLRGTTGDTE